jgi:hypothetical protein
MTRSSSARASLHSASQMRYEPLSLWERGWGEGNNGAIHADGPIRAALASTALVSLTRAPTEGVANTVLGRASALADARLPARGSSLPPRPPPRVQASFSPTPRPPFVAAPSDPRRCGRPRAPNQACPRPLDRPFAAAPSDPRRCDRPCVAGAGGIWPVTPLRMRCGGRQGGGRTAPMAPDSVTRGRSTRDDPAAGGSVRRCDRPILAARSARRAVTPPAGR